MSDRPLPTDDSAAPEAASTPETEAAPAPPPPQIDPERQRLMTLSESALLSEWAGVEALFRAVAGMDWGVANRFKGSVSVYANKRVGRYVAEFIRRAKDETEAASKVLEPRPRPNVGDLLSRIGLEADGEPPAAPVVAGTENES